jgi:hypothetical protein
MRLPGLLPEDSVKRSIPHVKTCRPLSPKPRNNADHKSHSRAVTMPFAQKRPIVQMGTIALLYSVDTSITRS